MHLATHILMEWAKRIENRPAVQKGLQVEYKSL